MRSYNPDRLVRLYLRQLNARLRGLPRAQRREVVSEVAAHIADGRAELRDQGETELRNLLDRLGDPSEIAAEARARFGATGESNGHEIAAMILLLVGGFVFVIGWFVGLVLLWTSKIWTTSDKLIGTLIFPFGLLFSAGVFFAAGIEGGCRTGPVPVSAGTIDPGIAASSCDGRATWTLGTILAVVVGVLVLIAPILTTVYLSWRLRQGRTDPNTRASYALSEAPN